MKFVNFLKSNTVFTKDQVTELEQYIMKLNMTFYSNEID